MSILDRILLVLLTVGSFCAAVLLFLFGTQTLAPGDLADVWSTQSFQVYAIVIGIVLAILSVRFFFYRWGNKSVDFVVLPGEHGHIRISFDTFRQLANRTGKAIRGVQEFETRVAGGTSGILLSVRVRALPDVELSQMSTEIQSAVKSYVEQTTGVTVDRITVNIVEIANGGAKGARVRVD